MARYDITIGKQEYSLPEMNFAATEAAWPYIEEAMLASSPVAGPNAGLAIVVCILVEDEDWDLMQPRWEDLRTRQKLHEGSSYREVFEGLHLYLKRKMLAVEIDQVRILVDKILEEAGLVAREGESPLEQPMKDEVEGIISQETSTISSRNSAPQELRGEAGS